MRIQHSIVVKYIWTIGYIISVIIILSPFYILEKALIHGLFYPSISKSNYDFASHLSDFCMYSNDTTYRRRTIPPLSELALTPQPPFKGMGFIAQKPPADYADFPEEIGSHSHPFLRTRTYQKVYREQSCNGCFPYIHKNVLNVDSCDGNSSAMLLIIVTTVPNEGAMRNAIRTTWGRNTNTTRTVFLLGVGWSTEEQRMLMAESSRYGDILQENYVDSYFNLSLKVLSGFHWWKKHCPKIPFILRTACDNFINVPFVLEYFKTETPAQKVLFGRCPKKAPVLRDLHSKWFVSELEYKDPEYIPYCGGTAFILSAITVDLILETSPDVPYFAIEDVYFGLVMDYARPNSTVTMPLQFFDVKYVIRPTISKDVCSIKGKWMTIHNVLSPAEMCWIWQHCRGPETDQK